MKPLKPPFGRGRGDGGSSSSRRLSADGSNPWRSVKRPAADLIGRAKNNESPEELAEPFTSIIKKDVVWFNQTQSDIILHLEKEDIPAMQQADRLLYKYLDTTFYPTLALKSRAWIKTIVIQKGMEITHFWSNNQQAGPPQYSKCIIKEVILPRNWAINPNQELPLVKANNKEVYNFNYWDYKDAFFKVFLYQNPKQKHTWLIKLCPEAVHKGLPSWFFSWWKIYGAQLDMLPKEIMELYSAWLESHPVISKMNDDEIITNLCNIYFFAEVEIPWIWTWSVKADWDEDQLPCLKRHYHYHWWSGIIIEEKVKQLLSIIEQNSKILESTITQEVQRENPTQKIAKMLRRKYPQESDSQIQQRCLEFLRKQFFEVFDNSDTKSQKSSNSTDEILPDAQNPDDDMQSMWDEAMGILAPIPAFHKGKNPIE